MVIRTHTTYPPPPKHKVPLKICSTGLNSHNNAGQLYKEWAKCLKPSLIQKKSVFMIWDPISAGSSSLGFIGGGQVGAGCWLVGGCHQTGGGSGTSRCGKTCKLRKNVCCKSVCCILQKYIYSKCANIFLKIMQFRLFIKIGTNK